MKNGLQETYYDDGSLWMQQWYKDDRLHREGQPAEIWYNKDGSTYSRQWHIDGKLHREDGPARIYYYEDGSTNGQLWCKDGRHLIDIIPQEMLVAYMKTNDLTLAELLLDNDELVRTSTQGYDWSSVS